jgi:hypothetical protein
MVVHTCNPSIWQAEGEDLKFEASLGYTVRPCLNTKAQIMKKTKKTPQQSTNID